MSEKEPVFFNDRNTQTGFELEKCIVFLNSIGIEIKKEKLPGNCLLPGVNIEAGRIIIDLKLLEHPGDILHEAGHIAVVPSAERHLLDADTIGKRPDSAAEEMMAIAWSYAACVHLQIDPHYVFHENGYRGGGSSIADNFKKQQYLGLPMLQWIGLAADKIRAGSLGIDPYPNMIKWMRD